MSMTIEELAKWIGGSDEPCTSQQAVRRLKTAAALLRELADKRAKFAQADRDAANFCDELKWDAYTSSLNTALESESDMLLGECE